MVTIALFIILLLIGLHCLYLRRLETFSNGSSSFTLCELADVLESLHRYISKQSNKMYLLDVKNIEKHNKTAKIVFSAFNNDKFITKMYYIEIDVTTKTVYEFKENIVSYDDNYLKSIDFGNPSGQYDDQRIKNNTFFPSSINLKGQDKYSLPELHEKSINKKLFAFFSVYKNNKNMNKLKASIASIIHDNKISKTTKIQLFSFLSDPENRKRIAIENLKHL